MLSLSLLVLSLAVIEGRIDNDFYDVDPRPPVIDGPPIDNDNGSPIDNDDPSPPVLPPFDAIPPPTDRRVVSPFDFTYIGAVCKNFTRPYSDENDLVYTAMSCDALSCPNGFRCEQAIDVDRPIDYFVCCNAAYSDRFDDVWRCPNDDTPGLAFYDDFSVSPVWAERCDALAPICANFTDDHYTCLQTEQVARCCPTTWPTTPLKKECPIGRPYHEQDTTKQPTCGYFFRKEGDNETCPRGNKCVEREERAYCCEKPPRLPLFNALIDLFNDTCSNATDDVHDCLDRYLPENISISRGALVELKITSDQKSIRQMAEGFVANLTTSLKDDDEIFNVTARYNRTAFVIMREEVCANYSLVSKCVHGVDTYGCRGVEMLRSFSSDILDLVCTEESFRRLLDALDCFVTATKVDGAAMSKCAKKFAERVGEDVSFGREYVFNSLCTNIGVFAECAGESMSRVCGGENTMRQAIFLAKVWQEIFSPIFGKC